MSYRCYEQILNFLKFTNNTQRINNWNNSEQDLQVKKCDTQKNCQLYYKKKVCRNVYAYKEENLTYNRFAHKTFTESIIFISMFLLVRLKVPLFHKPLLVKLFYEYKRTTSIAVIDFRHIKKVQRNYTHVFKKLSSHNCGNS